jgi:hypothetical protein
MEADWVPAFAGMTKGGKRSFANTLDTRHAELVSASIEPPRLTDQEEKWTLKQVQGD